MLLLRVLPSEPLAGGDSGSIVKQEDLLIWTLEDRLLTSGDIGEVTAMTDKVQAQSAQGYGELAMDDGARL
jgi:hypothetical protein